MSVVVLLTLSVQGVHSSYSVDSDARGQHCSPPSGSVDGGIVVEDGGGGVADITTITWQVALGSTLCYRYNYKVRVFESIRFVFVFDWFGLIQLDLV